MTEPTAIPQREAMVENGLLQGLSALASAVVSMPLELEVPGVEQRPGTAARDRRATRRLRRAPARAHRRAAAGRRGRLHRCRQVHAGQLDRRSPRLAPRASCAPRRAPRCWSTTPPTPSGSGRAGSCPRSSARARTAVAPTRSARSPAPRCGPASPCSTPPTSTRSTRPTATWPSSCSAPPTCGSSSRRPRATPTRCRGTTCAAPPSGTPRSPWCWTARRPRPSSRCVATSRGC